MRIVLVLGFVMLLAPHADGQTLLFSDNFEVASPGGGRLVQWSGQNGGAYSAAIQADPLDGLNHVIAFTELTGLGDIFSLELPVEDGVLYALHFDYLGQPGLGEPGNLGGFAGYAQDAVPTRGRWLAGTILESHASIELIDDGTWHSYTINFDPFAVFAPSNNTIRVMFEDWDGAHGIPGDAYFDNISVESLKPEAKQTTWGAIKAAYEHE